MQQERQRQQLLTALIPVAAARGEKGEEQLRHLAKELADSLFPWLQTDKKRTEEKAAEILDWFSKQAPFTFTVPKGVKELE